MSLTLLGIMTPSLSQKCLKNKREFHRQCGEKIIIILHKLYIGHCIIECVKSPVNRNFRKFSTPYTLLDPDYDTEDVVDRLKELKVEEHSETKIDKK